MASCTVLQELRSLVLKWAELTIFAAVIVIYASSAEAQHGRCTQLLNLCGKALWLCQSGRFFFTRNRINHGSQCDLEGPGDVCPAANAFELHLDGHVLET